MSCPGSVPERPEFSLKERLGGKCIYTIKAVQISVSKNETSTKDHQVHKRAQKGKTRIHTLNNKPRLPRNNS